jgi:peptidyl-prolyl cis-trans isomerase D
VFAGEDGQFSPANYNMALQVLQASGTPESTVVGVLKQDYRLQQLREIAGGPGFVLPYEVQVRGEVQRTQWTVEMASSNLESFNPAIEPREEDLRQAFEQNPARFEVPAKIELGAVLFPGTAFLSEVAAPEEGELRAYFERNKARYGQPAPQPAEGEEPQPAPEPVFEEVREAVAADLALEKANRIAQERADAYTMELWRSEAQKLTPQALEIARGMGASVEDIAPYAENSPPRDTPVPPQALANAWSLTSSERFFSDVIPTRGGAAVLLYKGTIPARQPAFEEVRDDVAADWLASASATSSSSKATLARGYPQRHAGGRSFKEAAEAQGLSVRASPTSTPPACRSSFASGRGIQHGRSPMLLARKDEPG